MNEGIFSELKSAIEKLLKAIPTNDEVRERTPTRYVNALQEMIKGYWMDPEEVLTQFNDEGDPMEKVGDLVIIRNAPVRSMCEHHLLPFFGYAHLAYVPAEHIIGFSKFARVVEVYARRLQLQERMTRQIADAINEYVKPLGLIVIVECTHTCAKVRGVNAEDMRMRTSALRGIMKFNPYLKQEALELLLRELK